MQLLLAVAAPLTNDYVAIHSRLFVPARSLGVGILPGAANDLPAGQILPRRARTLHGHLITVVVFSSAKPLVTLADQDM